MAGGVCWLQLRPVSAPVVAVPALGRLPGQGVDRLAQFGIARRVNVVQRRGRSGVAKRLLDAREVHVRRKASPERPTPAMA